MHHRVARTGEQVEVQLEAYGIKGDTQDVHFELWDNDYWVFDNKHAQIKDQTIRWTSVGQSAGWKKGSFTWTVPASSNLRLQFTQTLARAITRPMAPVAARPLRRLVALGLELCRWLVHLCN
jgi:hypothetical protein